MKLMNKVTISSEYSWRRDAARIVEELFSVTDSAHWDMLLDLRHHFLKGEDWNKTLDLFLECRRLLEADHYLPFYRLRRLLTGSLRLEACSQKTPAKASRVLCPLADLWKHQSLSDIQRAARREWFEHDIDSDVDDWLSFNVVECESPKFIASR